VSQLTYECMMRLRHIAGLLMLSHGLSVLQPRTAVAMSPSASSVSVVSQHDRDFLTVAVQDVSLRLLMTEIAALAGFQFVELVPTERSVSVTLSNVPVDQALSRILYAEQLNFVLVYQDEESTKLRRVLVAESRHRHVTPPKGGAETPEMEAEPSEVGVEDRKIFGPETPLEQILGWAVHPDPEIRTAALEALALHEANEQARVKLAESVNDSDASVRLFAIGLLGPFLVQWPQAQDVVMEALQDHEPSIRRLALVALWESSSARIGEALNLALRDHEPEIRDQARKFADEMSIMENSPDSVQAAPAP
jgi:hypothetical protein